MTKASISTDETGFLRNPLAHWRNDDLMLHEETRNQVMSDRPRAFSVLDWPELRVLFEEIDERSKAAKEKVRTLGVWAVTVATAGLVLAALATWLVPPGSIPARSLGVAAVLLLIVGVGLGLKPILSGRGRSAWLVTRLQAERLRQLYFQFLLANLPLAVQAMKDNSASKELRDARTKTLARFRDRFLATPSTALHEVLEDKTYERVWHDQTWAAYPASGTIPADDETDELLESLRRLRFGVQRHYASLTQQEHVNAPGVRAAWLHSGANVMTVAVLLASLGLAVALMFNLEGWDSAFVALAASSAASVAAFRTFDEGLRYTDDATRMGWYLESIDALEASYDRLQAPGRVRLQQQLEALAYREMRDFLCSHHQARFVLQ